MEYPDGNPGVFPADPETPEGEFRLLFGDTTAENYNPPAFGGTQRSYVYFSDNEITAFLAMSNGSISRGIGFAYAQLAGAAAMEAKSVKDYDLTVDLTKRSGELRALSQWWFDRADDEDDADGNGDVFDLIDLSGPGDIIPEGLLPVYGRISVPGRIR